MNSSGCRRSRGRTGKSERSAAPQLRGVADGRGRAGRPSCAAMIPQGFGAGVGRWARITNRAIGIVAAPVRLFIAWIYGEQNQIRPMFPPNTSQEDLIRASKAFDLAQQLPPIDWAKALHYLPVMDIIKAVDGPHGDFRRQDAGGYRRRDDQAHAQRSGLVQERGLYEDHPISVPGFTVHVLVRRFGGTESCRPRTIRLAECAAEDRESAIRW